MYQPINAATVKLGNVITYFELESHFVRFFSKNSVKPLRSALLRLFGGNNANGCAVLSLQCVALAHETLEQERQVIGEGVKPTVETGSLTVYFGNN